MDVLQLILRLVHVVGGVYWAGTIIFYAVFLFPAMRDAGPDAAKVGAALIRRHLAEITPAVAILTIVAGFWLFARASAGAGAQYMHSGAGIAYGIGGVAGIVALVIGATVLRPSLMKAVSLSQSAEESPPAERERWLAAAQALHIRTGKAGNVMAVLLVIAAVTMAIARYV